jgi:hypothetical protein
MDVQAVPMDGFRRMVSMSYAGWAMLGVNDLLTVGRKRQRLHRGFLTRIAEPWVLAMLRWLSKG